MNDIDDKLLIVVALTVISIVSAFVFRQEAIPIINNIVAGLLGMAVGHFTRG